MPKKLFAPNPRSDAGRAALDRYPREFRESLKADILAIENEVLVGTSQPEVLRLLRLAEQEFVPVYGGTELGYRVRLAQRIRLHLETYDTLLKEKNR